MSSPNRDRRGDRPRTAPPRDRDRRGDDRRSDGGSYRGSQRGSNASVISGGSRGSQTDRGDRGGQRRGGERSRPKSADGTSGYRGDRTGMGDGRSVPVHQVPKDLNQFAMNSPSYTGGRLPNGRLLSGVTPEGMVFHPRAGYSRTQFGGHWEDHKTENRPWPPQSATKSGFSDFDAMEPPETSTYQNHFGLTFDGMDSMGHVKPNMAGTATALRAVNGYGRNCNGGYFMREALGEIKRYKHSESWRAMPAWARGIPEPTRPGPGFTRSDQGGYFRT